MRILLLLSLTLSSCCAITSSCNCNPPPPALILEATAWISPYDSLDAITFIDPSGNIDTFSLQKFSDTESCGGDE